MNVGDPYRSPVREYCPTSLNSEGGKMALRESARPYCTTEASNDRGGKGLGIKCLRDGSSWDNGLDVSKTKFKDGFHLEKRANCKS